MEEDGTFSIWGIQPDRAFVVWAEAGVASYETAFTERLVYDGENSITGVEIALGKAPVAPVGARCIEHAAQFMGDFDSGLSDIGQLSLETQQAINALAFYEITLGRPNGTCQPAASVTRSQMALFLARVFHSTRSIPPIWKHRPRSPCPASPTSQL
ncbi:MAG: hypothetical protein JXA87_08630 [Thermoleophilia bacterium]|nr:hypothetical protein [Thermoleophilia bacterium]